MNFEHLIHLVCCAAGTRSIVTKLSLINDFFLRIYSLAEFLIYWRQAKGVPKEIATLRSQ
jgi:hypothetical protein